MSIARFLGSDTLFTIADAILVSNSKVAVVAIGLYN